MNSGPGSTDDDLVARIAASAGLPPGIARRIVDDVLAHHAELPEDYVARRHRELVAQGWKNPRIFDRLCEEVAGRVFRGPVCSARQIRRMIYG